MALMSLTGWAQTATLGDVAIGEYTYGGATLPDPVVENNKGAILDVNTHYTFENDKAYSDADCTTAVALSALKADGTTKYYMKISGAGAYTGQQKGVWFLVKKAALTIAYDNTDGNLNRGYGEAQKDLTAAKFGAAAGWKWDDADNAATLLKGTHPTSYSTADNNVGANKPITFVGGKTADNYTVTYTGTLTITAKNVGDDADPATNKATISAFQGDVTYTGNPIVGVYTIKDGDKTLTAGTAAVLYTLEEYNAAHPTATVADETAYAGVALADKTKTPATGDYYVSEVRNVNWDGTTVIENRPTITFQGNYTGTMTIPATKGFKVNPAPITVSVKDIEYTYDNANHKTLTGLDVVKFEYAGIVGADVDKAANIKKCFGGHAVVVKDGADAINAAEYVLTISGGTINTAATDPATTEAKNYKFETYLPGKMTIKKRPLTIKADPKSKALGAEDPENSYTIAVGTLLKSTEAPVYADAISGITYTRQEGETVGSYDITPVFTTAKVTRTAGATKTDVTANYEFKAATPAGQLTIGKGAIVVTLKDAEKFYGQADPTEFEYVVTGLQDGDEIGEVKTSRDKSAENPEAVKSYVITATVTNPNPAKYTSLTVVPGIFTIKKAQLDFTMATQSVKKNPTDAEKTAALKKELVTVTGINNSDKAVDLYALTYKAGIAFDANKTIADGVVATLTEAARASYEIITAKDDEGKVTATGNTISGKLIIGAGSATAITFTSSDGKAATTTEAAVPSDYSLITNNAGETVTATLVINPRNVREVPAGTKHTWAAQTWNTMVLPFEISVADLSKALGYAIVNRVDAANTTEGNVQFKLEMDKIPANEPFCVKTSQALPIMVSGVAQSITFENVTIVDGGENPSIDAGMGYKFVGAYKTKTIDKTTPTYNFLRGDNAKWAHIGSTSANTWDVLPFDAYIELTAAAAARGVTFTFQELDGSYTAIKAITVENTSAEANAEGWYTLGGVKLNGAPSQKGVYINNGKKIIIK